MSTMKIFKWIGTLFMGIGIVVTSGMILGGIFSKEYSILLFALIWGSIFTGIGALFRYIGSVQENRANRILENGTSYTGLIYRYDKDPSIIINGSYPISVVVRYMADEKVQEAIIPTMETSGQNYPLGHACTIKLYDGKAAIVPGSIELKQLPDQDLLTESSILEIQSNPRVRITCPYCGAAVNVPLGGSAKCEYCDSLIRIDEKGNVL